jgi:hypothetical protein
MRRLKVLMVLCALLLFAATANALSITPLTMPQYSGNQNNMREIQAAIALDPGVDLSTFLYKSEVDGGKEDGRLAGSYRTTYSNSPSDPADALIEYTGGRSIGGTDVWLLVKDGKQEPAWYLFDLDFLGWNGVDALTLSRFWPGNGAISNVYLYGTPVSEPATMLLLGFGLIGLAAFGRERYFKGA